MTSFLPPKQASIFYGVCVRTLTKWHKDGYIKIKRKKKGGWRLFEIDAGIPSRVEQERDMDRSEAPGPLALSFLPLQEALLFYGVTISTLIKWHKNGYIKIKRTKKGGKRLFRLFEIDAGIPLRVEREREREMNQTSGPGQKALSFLPTKQAMLFYGVTISTLNKWHKDGYIKIKRMKKKKSHKLFEIDAGIPLRVKCTKRQRNLCEKENCDICSERSFENNPKAEFWSEKNEKKPREICKSSRDLVLFNCNICPHEFKSKLSSITEGTWCPFCAKRKVCENECDFCKNNSFASEPKAEFWSEKNEKTPRDFLKSSSTDKFWFNCNICPHEFKSRLSSITAGHWCPFCAKRKVCENDCDFCKKNSFASHLKAEFWSEENQKTPRDFLKSSNDKFWFNCSLGHEFESTLNTITAGRWCPGCNNKTEQILYEWLKKIYPSDHIIKQFKTSWCKNLETKQKRRLPFDFLIEDLKLIIELDGRQHFIQVSNWKDPVETRKRDIYKMNQALLNGYSVIRLLQEDVWLDKNNWETNLKSAIQGLRSGPLGLVPKIIYICENNEYSVYNQ